MTGTSRRVLVLATGIRANGGIQRFNRTLLAALAELGCEIDVLSLSDPHAGTDLPGAKTRVRGFAGSRVRFALTALRLLAARRYDDLIVGHLYLLPLASLARPLCRLRRTRTLMIAHGIEIWYGFPRSTARALGRVSDILCVSRYTRGALLRQAPALDPARLRIFPNALSERWTGLDSPLRVELPERFVLSVGRLESTERYKGIVTVIESLAMSEDSGLEYLVVGQGNDTAFLRGVAERCGVAHRVRFLGGVGDAELAVLYRSCQAFVLPSANEGFGIVFLEAMFFGAPVIAAGEKGALDVVRDGETGLLVQFGDAAALQRAIDRLGNDAQLRVRLQRQGRESVIGGGEFTFRRFVERSAALFAPAAAR